ncbi:MAG: oxidoreductase [Eggerthellaceae bacterium]|nr:oxidoreductase [Eggerthellaceae bacterium]
MTQGILVDYNYCSGCETCVVACQQERGFTEKEFGVTVTKLGPFHIEPDKKHYEYDFIPQFTEWCNLCEERTAKGKLPSCVQMCQAQCMEWGEVSDLAKKATTPKQVIYSIKQD